jgi:hypothetical protein
MPWAIHTPSVLSRVLRRPTERAHCIVINRLWPRSRGFRRIVPNSLVLVVGGLSRVVPVNQGVQTPSVCGGEGGVLWVFLGKK